jgi:hypothetical protein
MCEYWCRLVVVVGSFSFHSHSLAAHNNPTNPKTKQTEHKKIVMSSSCRHSSESRHFRWTTRQFSFVVKIDSERKIGKEKVSIMIHILAGELL